MTAKKRWRFYSATRDAMSIYSMRSYITILFQPHITPDVRSKIGDVDSVRLPYTDMHGIWEDPTFTITYGVGNHPTSFVRNKGRMVGERVWHVEDLDVCRDLRDIADKIGNDSWYVIRVFDRKFIVATPTGPFYFCGDEVTLPGDVARYTKLLEPLIKNNP